MRPVPSDEHLLELIGALIANATALAQDAALLLEHDRYPRAYALAALASEELGKVYLCLDAVLSRKEIEPKRFWKLWREHDDKLDSAGAYATAFIDDLEALDVDRLRGNAGRIGARKLSAIYVDFDGNKPLTPDLVGRDDAAQLLKTAQLSIAHASKALVGLNMEVVAATHALGPKLSTVLDRLTQDKPREQAIADVRQFLAEVPGMTEDQLINLFKST